MRNRLFLVLAVTGLTLLAAAPAADSATPAPSGFTIVASPSVENGALAGVYAVSASDVWAVGRDGSLPLVEHYDGSSWSVLRMKAPFHTQGEQFSAVTVTGHYVWAVGRCHNDFSYEGCVSRYNGSRWYHVAIPTQFTADAQFDSIRAFSTTNVLIGGEIGGIDAIIRWNGKTWTRVKDVPYTGSISGIAGTLSTRLFSAGNSDEALFEAEQPGGSWRVGGLFGGMTDTGISASSAENVWVVGNLTVDPDTEYPLAVRWNGSAMVDLEEGTVSAFDRELTAVATTRPDNTWAVGYTATASGTDATVIDQYTGGPSLTELDSPNVAGVSNHLLAITAVPDSETDLWAVGFAGNQPLILHHSP